MTLQPAAQPPVAATRSGPNLKTIISLVTTLAVAAVGLFAVLNKGSAEAAVIYEAPLAAGPDPFTSPVDVAATGVGALIPTPPPEPTPSPTPGQTSAPRPIKPGNFGGTGFTTVCDREQLIRQLQANPLALNAWASVHKLSPGDVPSYIRSLRPSSLARDTRVTNHSFKGGKAVPFQSIQAAGTAVLIDDSGRVVARCRCGNPLLEPIPIGSGTCKGCPKNYTPPTLLPRGQVPPVVTVVNPPPVSSTGGPGTSPPTTTPAIGQVSGTYSPAGVQVLSGGSQCDPSEATPFEVRSGPGTALAFIFSNSQQATPGSPRLTLRGVLNPNGNFDVSLTDGTDRLQMTGRFAGGRILDGRYVFDYNQVSPPLKCTYGFTATRV